MSDADGAGRHQIIDQSTRLTDADVKLFNEQIAPLLRGTFGRMIDEKFIGHTARSEFSSDPENNFSESPLYKAWAEDYKAQAARRSRIGSVNAENFLMKNLVMTFEREGGEPVIKMAMERVAKINEQERMEQIRLQFVITAAEDVIKINKQLGIVKMFTAKSELAAIESRLWGKDVRPNTVMEDPQAAIDENTAALEKINGGKPIPLYEFKPI